ncbi:TIGR04338 family metallohydrolase [Millisia brevis]|uniref:TIGR04338 family metallohydrolase n=1 Tax=Millisia brevis TaxID=264148 RepID=UPI000A022910|nr:TIGR04338 family metallohydrolase [Millisia brevis]
MSGGGRRDEQRQRVYDAESLVQRMFDRADGGTGRQVQLHGSTITLPVERRFGSVDSAEDYLRRVLDLAGVRAAFPRSSAPVAVRTRRGATAAHYEHGTATIAIPDGRDGRWALRELVVLHELAHHLGDPDAEEAAHGGDFVARTLELVEIVMGPEAAFVLRVAYAGTGARAG